MASLRSILASISLFLALAFAAPISQPEADVVVVKRNSDVIHKLVQYFDNLGAEIRNLTSEFETLASQVSEDVAHDHNLTVTQIVDSFESIFQSNGTVQGFFTEINPANITGDELLQLTGSAISVARDLLLFVPTAASWIVQAYIQFRSEYQRLFRLPHEVLQFVLGLFATLTGLVPGFGTSISVFLNLLKAADSVFYQIL